MKLPVSRQEGKKQQQVMLSRRVINGFIWVILPAMMLPASCRKEEEPPQPATEIVIGDYSGMFSDTSQRAIEAPYNGYDEILIDLDDNDSADLRLLVVEYGSPGLGVRHMSEVESLNRNTAIYGVFTTDTTFLHRTVAYYSDDYNLYKVTNSWFRCRRYLPSDWVERVETRFHGLHLELGDKLSLSDTFSPDTVSFIYSSQSPVYYYVLNDTVCADNEYYQDDCYAVPFGRDIYLGILHKGASERLGWIRIVLQSNRIILKEYAIQKPPS